MLTHLRIENFILIERLELSFHEGLTVLTGETGAGKSILLDAVEGVLGGKLGGTVIRAGASKAFLEGTFLSSAAISHWLEAQELDPAEELVISREISAKSNRYRLNGVVVNQSMVQAVRELLVDVTAQGQTLGLSRPNVQQALLDRFAQAEPAVLQVREAYQRWHMSKRQLEQAIQQQQQDKTQREHLRQQFQELKTARITDPKEEENLIAEQAVLLHTTELTTTAATVYELLYRGSASVSDQLNQAHHLLEAIAKHDSHILPWCEMVQSALVQTEECARQIQHYSEQLETDPERLTTVEQRLRELQKICLKYGPTLADVVQVQQQIQQQWQHLKANTPALEELKAQVQQNYEILLSTCGDLTALRTAAITRLEQDISQALAPLGMAKARFQVQSTPIPPSAEGQEAIEFLLAANPGQAPAPLKAVASGGEMARFLLSLKVALGEQIPTLIFDEIDVGVSGKVAQAVATKLFQLARHHQVLCVTHQPLVAAMADIHWRVRKQVHQQETTVYVDELTAIEERTEELAQLVGGHSATEAKDFVTALLAQAQQLQSSTQR
jgi:DNA repair protein RecN (Recombination protein N)